MKKITSILSAAIASLTLLCTAAGSYYAAYPNNFYLCESESFSAGKFVTAEVCGNEATLKLFGIIPLKNVEAEAVERPKLVPCGTPFGLKILTDGVIVTGFGSENSGGNSPAEKSGIKKGDVIVAVNGLAVTDGNSITELLKSGNNKITVMREGEKLDFTIIPEVSEEGAFRIGTWIRDSCAGIGTLTFYNPENGVFAGLGHSVCDIDTGITLPVSKGEIVPVSINKIIKGISGKPGELCGSFLSGAPIGKISANLSDGIFGTAKFPSIIGEPVEMAFRQEVKTGPATILTTLNGMCAEEYDVVIEKVDLGGSDVKNLVIKVTDKNLLSQTGGIVQGMSGSPIIQEGRLVGAVTHVFVNDITRGYGVFAENMFRSSNTIL